MVLEKKVKNGESVPHEVDWTPEKIARVWDFYGSNAVFDRDRFSLQSGVQIVKWAKCLIPFAGKTVMDYGCGPGHLLRSILSLTDIQNCIGIDFSEGSLHSAQKLTRGDPRFSGTILVQELPVDLPPDYADVVFMIEVIEHLQDACLQATLREVNRLLKTGGHLVVTTPNKEDIEGTKRICPDCGAIFHPKQHVRSWDAEALSSTLDRFCFQVVSIVETNWVHRRTTMYRILGSMMDRLRQRPRAHLGIIVRKTGGLL